MELKIKCSNKLKSSLKGCLIFKIQSDIYILVESTFTNKTNYKVTFLTC